MDKTRPKCLQFLVDYCNKYLRDSEDDKKEIRQAMADLLEAVLTEAGCYRGFNYTYWLEKGYQEWLEAGGPKGKAKDAFIFGPSGDETRVQYS